MAGYFSHGYKSYNKVFYYKRCYYHLEIMEQDAQK